MNPLLAILAPQLQSANQAALLPGGTVGANGTGPETSSGLSANTSAFLQILSQQVASVNGESNAVAPNTGEFVKPLLPTFSDAVSSRLQTNITSSQGTETLTPSNEGALYALRDALNGSLASNASANPVPGEETDQSATVRNLLDQAINVSSKEDLDQLNALAQKILNDNNIAPDKNGSPLDTLISRLVNGNLIELQQAANTNLQAATQPGVAQASQQTVSQVNANRPTLQATAETENGEKRPVRFLSNSTKLFEGTQQQFSTPANAAALATEQTEEQLVENNGQLARAAKSYATDEGKNQLTSLNQRNALPPADVQIANTNTASLNTSNDVTINNLSFVDGAKTPDATVKISTSNNQSQLASNTLPAAEQASIKIAEALKDGVQRIQIKLDPASLGSLDVRMELSKDAESHVRIIVERPETLSMLQRDIGMLRDSLQNAGFQTGSGNIDLSLKGENSNDNFDTAGKGDGNGNGGNESGESESADGDAIDQSALTRRYVMNLEEGNLDITV